MAYEQAVQDHEREVERLKAECGVTAAQELEDAAPRGGKFGAGRLGRHARQDAGWADLQSPLRGDSLSHDEYDEDVMVSIVDDLLAMAEEAEGLANV